MSDDDSVLVDESGTTKDDSAIHGDQSAQPVLLQVYGTGETTVVGFGGKTIPPDHNVAVYRDQIVGLIKEHGTTELAFDLTGMRIVPSGIVGLMATMHKHGVSVTLYNASAEIREVFEITRLDDVVTFREIDVSEPEE